MPRRGGRFRSVVLVAEVADEFRHPLGFPETDPLAMPCSRGAPSIPSKLRSRLRAAGVRAFNLIEIEIKLSALSAEFNTMKAVSKLVVLLKLGVLAGAVAYASDTDEQIYLKSCNKDPGVPVPVVVVAPTVGAEFNGGLVQLEFTVDEYGIPAAFSVKSATDDVLATAVVKAVKQWRFLPAELDGKRVAKKVSLPVKIIDYAVPGERYAAAK